MREDEETTENNQIPMGKDVKTKGKPSDPYGERLKKSL